VTGINISIGSDEKDFLRGVKNSADGVDDLADALKDVDKAGDKAGDALEQDFKVAQKATKNFNDAVRDGEDALRKTASASKTATREVADDFELSTNQQKTLRRKALSEIKDEAKANAAETFSSFDGSAASFADGIQGTLGGLVSSLGPVGLAVAGVAALAIGTVNGLVQKATTDTEAYKSEVGELAGSYIEVGQKGIPALERLQKKLEDLAKGTDKSGKSLADIKKEADGLGTSYRGLTSAYAGNAKQIDLQLKLAKQLVAANDQQIAASSLTGDALNAELSSRALWAAHTVTDLETVKQKQKDAASAAQYYADNGGKALDAQIAKQKEHADLVKGFSDSVQSNLHDAGSAWEDYNNDGTTTLDEYNAHIEASITANANYLANIKTLSKQVSKDALDYVTSLGASAAPILDAFVKAPLDQQQRTAANWDSLGKASGKSYTDALKSTVPTTVPGPQISLVGPSTSDLQNALRNVPKNVRVPVIVDLVTAGGKKIPY